MGHLKSFADLTHFIIDMFSIIATVVYSIIILCNNINVYLFQI